MLQTPADTAIQLGGYREWAVAGPMAQLCQAAWIYEAGDAPVSHRLLPDQNPSLILIFQTDFSGRISDGEMMIGGGCNTAVWYRPKPGELQIAYRLYPEVAAEMMGVCPKEYQNTSAAPPRDLAHCLDGLLEDAITSSPETLLSKMGRRLMASSREIALRDEQRAARLIRASGGQISIAGIATKLGCSERKIRRGFNSTMGMSPKAYGRLIRHVEAICMADDMADPDWADIAIANGYCDQSHLIREVKHLTGASPARLHAERRTESEISNT